MRINKFVAQASGLSRRGADAAIAEGRVKVNGQTASLGQDIAETDAVLLDGQPLVPPAIPSTTIVLNKPVGYVVSRNGQGSRTIYDLLPAEYHSLKPIGRLDKDSSGLLLLTNDGQLAHELTHPSKQKMKCYEIKLDKPLTPQHWTEITTTGVQLEDGLSKFELNWLDKNDGLKWLVTMYEGRNRQIRRTFAALGYKVMRLHRTQFGPYQLGSVKSGQIKVLDELTE